MKVFNLGFLTIFYCNNDYISVQRERETEKEREEPTILSCFKIIMQDN